jgi:glutathione peroxidase
MFAKSSLSGPESNPLYQALVTRSGERPRWNFHKYLVDRAGARVLSFGSAVAPESRELVAAIESFLQDK